MRKWILAVAVLTGINGVGVAVIAEPVLLVQTNREITLPSGAVAADIRFGPGSDVLIAAGRDGVRLLHRREDGSLTWSQKVGGERDRSGFFFSRMIASHRHTIVVGSPFNAIGWTRSRSPVSTFAFTSAIDVEVVGDRLFILGANRDGQGRWAPEGAIAWTGTLSSELRDLRPLVFSVDRDSNPPSVGIARCGSLEMGSIRAVSENEILVVPGIEPGAYVFDRNGRLVRTFDTGGLRFLDRCGITQDQATLFARDMPSRMRWLNRARTLDEIVVVEGRPALIVRHASAEGTQWDMVLLDARGRPLTTIRLPFKSPSPNAHVRADVVNRSAVFLIRAYGEKRDRSDEPPSRLVFATVDVTP